MGVRMNQNLGWTCSKCGRSYSPFKVKAECDYCNDEIKKREEMHRSFCNQSMRNIERNSHFMEGYINCMINRRVYG